VAAVDLANGHTTLEKTAEVVKEEEAGAGEKKGEEKNGEEKKDKQNEEEKGTEKRSIDKVNGTETETEAPAKAAKPENAVLTYLQTDDGKQWKLLPEVAGLIQKYDGEMTSAPRAELERQRELLSGLGVEGMNRREGVETEITNDIKERDLSIANTARLNGVIISKQNQRVGYSDMVGRAIAAHQAIGVFLSTVDQAEAVNKAVLSEAQRTAENKAARMAAFEADKSRRMMAIAKESFSEGI